MSKGLEALERLMADYYEMCQDLGNNDDQYQRWNLTSERAIIEKELKALQIIKKKHVHTRMIQMVNNEFTYLDYNKQFAREPSEDLTKEEYDLIKEVLL